MSRLCLLLLVALLSFSSHFLPVHAEPISRVCSVTDGHQFCLLAAESVDAGTTVAFLVQSQPHVLARFAIKFGSSTYVRSNRAGKHGRASILYSAPLFTGRAATLTVTARAAISHHRFYASETVLVKPFVPKVGFLGIQILHEVGTSWVPTMQVRLGETVRFVASYVVTEPAGNFLAGCVTGTLQVTQNATTLFSAPVRCAVPQPSNAAAYVYVETHFTDRSYVGALVAEFDLTYPDGEYGVARGRGTTRFEVVPAGGGPLML